MTYTVLTPYLVPRHLAKRTNAGDGFVLGACESLIGSRASAYFSSWEALADEAISQINSSQFLLLAGTNRLKDELVICPDFSLRTLDKIKVPVILMGQGHYGVPSSATGMTANSITMMEALLERFPMMSVRCDASAHYMRTALPKCAEMILMTSCPAAYPVDGIDKGFERKGEYDCLVATITDRSNLQSQLAFLRYIPKVVRARRRVVALHQDYGNNEVKNFIRSLGYEVFSSSNYEDYIDLYKASDLHIGNRLHAHLKCLSMGVVSFLLPFDLRQAYFADSLDFPLLSTFPNSEMAAYDFNRYRSRLAAADKAMTRFLEGVRGIGNKRPHASRL